MDRSAFYGFLVVLALSILEPPVTSKNDVSVDASTMPHNSSSTEEPNSRNFTNTNEGTMSCPEGDSQLCTAPMENDTIPEFLSEDPFEYAKFENINIPQDTGPNDHILDVLMITTEVNRSSGETEYGDKTLKSHAQTEHVEMFTETNLNITPNSSVEISTASSAEPTDTKFSRGSTDDSDLLTQIQTNKVTAPSTTDKREETSIEATSVSEVRTTPALYSQSTQSPATMRVTQESWGYPPTRIIPLFRTTASSLVTTTESTNATENMPQVQTDEVTEAYQKRQINKDACYQRPVIELCHNTSTNKSQTQTQRVHGTWYYDSVEMGCHYTSDCILNSNAFETREECENTCMPPTGPVRCLAPPKAGYFQCSETSPARGVVPILMIFFDKTTGKCRWFTYYGCGGSANRFQSIDECEATCGEKTASKIFMVAAELCRVAPSEQRPGNWSTHKQLEHDMASDDLASAKAEANFSLFEGLTMRESKLVEPGCRNIGQAESRWYLDSQTGTCKEFAYSHCGGSANNFLTRTDCEQFCGAKKEEPEDICVMSADVGECSSPREMWYYDPELLEVNHFGEHNSKGGCQTFIYSGCGGNANRFADRATCEHTCGHLRRPEPDAGDPALVTVTVPSLNNTEGGLFSTTLPTGSQSTPNMTKSSSPDNTKQQMNKTVHSEIKSVELLNIDLEPCRRHPLVGNCRPLNCSKSETKQIKCQPLLLQRWFFNAHTSNCEPFQYSGCGGSENTFDDAQACQVACKARIVRPDRDRRCDSLPHHTKCYSLSLGATSGLLSNSTIAFHFSLGSATCKAFHLDTSQPGCDMLSYFSNGHECLNACVRSTPTEKHLQNRCFARKTHATWTCESEHEKTFRWSYLSELNQCVQFSQCAHNSTQPGNNFASRSVCEATCMATSLEEVCQLPMERGPCHATQTRYYYDIKSAKCRMFLYGGCLGNSNRFLSRQECESACGKFASHMISHNVTTLSDVIHATSGRDTAPPVPAEVFDKMRRITQRHTDHFPWDLCLESHWYGTCPTSTRYHAISSGYPFTQLTRFFYDRRLGKCQPFTYTGCGARGNHFDTAQGCKEVCEDRLRNPKSARCHQVSERNICPGSGVQGWAFNHSIGDCHLVEVCPSGVIIEPTGPTQFAWDILRKRRTSHWLGTLHATTGQAPQGVYATRSACQYHCLPKPPRGTDAQNVCHMNPTVTVPFGCNAMVTRWYFEPREANCRSYITCPQYGNNFPTEQACRSICMPTHPLDVCRLPRDHGGCSQFQTRWHYDMSKRACVPFIYGGCFGNSNRFLSRAECESFCTSRDVCRLPLQRNSSDPTYPRRYYFDHVTGKCRAFHFTGILAHGNNFPTMEACVATCLYIPDLEVIDVDAPATNALPKVGRDSGFGADNLKTSSVRDVVISSTDIRTSDIFVTEHKSLCVMSMSDMGANNLVEQTICEPEDIIHELGHRFRPVRTKSERGDEVDGYCEQTLVPICLTEQRRVFGTIMDPLMHTIGRVFRTQAECEEICLNRRRVRRSATQLGDLVDGKEELVKIVDGLLRESGYDSDSTSQLTVRNGCSPEKSMAEQVDHFRHQFQVYSRWPCKFDMEKAAELVPLIERLAGSNTWLPCWIISARIPTVYWRHLKDGKTYPVTPIKIPALNNVWQAHLQLYHVDPSRHNGAWSCNARSFSGQTNFEVMVLLHVVPRLFLEQHVIYRNETAEPVAEHLVTVPEGGTLLLGCRIKEESGTAGYLVTPEFTWNRLKAHGSNGNADSFWNLAGVELLYIKPVNSSQHAGLWSCGKTSAVRGNVQEQVKFFVSVGRAPVFEREQPRQIFRVSKHQPNRFLECGAADFGQPIGKLTWYRCRGDRGCIPLGKRAKSEKQNLLVSAIPGDRYTCRIENMWGFVEQHFYFKPLF
ncbi:Papilin [Clonorchis sinensis]|uniref:Papilin n=1 Tax=Clonorchis sinensis TaxID=79923 RepID=A0A8T1MDU9_CLOSI|nr:Papilin [Clonorchis sinensis]